DDELAIVHGNVDSIDDREGAVTFRQPFEFHARHCRFRITPTPDGPAGCELFCLRMIPRIKPGGMTSGKPLDTFPDHAHDVIAVPTFCQLRAIAQRLFCSAVCLTAREANYQIVLAVRAICQSVRKRPPTNFLGRRRWTADAFSRQALPRLRRRFSRPPSCELNPTRSSAS